MWRGLMVIFGFCEGVEHVECVFGRVLNVCFYAPTLTVGGVKGDKVSAFVIFEVLFLCQKGVKNGLRGSERLRRGKKGLARGSERLRRGRKGLTRGSGGFARGRKGVVRGSEGLRRGKKGLTRGSEGLARGKKRLVDVRTPFP